MRGKLLLVVGLAAGYVLGAKAGRGRYEDIKRATSKLWGDPRVQRQVKNVEGRAKEFAKDKAPEVVDFLSDGAKKVVSQVSGSKSASGKSPAARSAAAAKPASASGK
ncbi:YtxH domain-containing protein [Lacisediminihabitans sp. FW035]